VCYFILNFAAILDITFFLPCNSSLVLLSLVSDVMYSCDAGHCIIFMCFGESVTWQDICSDEAGCVFYPNNFSAVEQ